MERWADSDPGDAVPDYSKTMPVSSESRRRVDLGADGWLEGDDGLWRKSFRDAQWVPKCSVGNVTRTVVRDGATGTVIHDSCGSMRGENTRVARAFRKPRSVDVIAEINLAEEPSAEAIP